MKDSLKLGTLKSPCQMQPLLSGNGILRVGQKCCCLTAGEIEQPNK